MFSQPFTQRVSQRCWRVSTRSFDVRCVFSQHDEISQFWLFVTHKTREVSVSESAGDLTSTVSTEVHENQ